MKRDWLLSATIGVALGLFAVSLVVTGREFWQSGTLFGTEDTGTSQTSIQPTQDAHLVVTNPDGLGYLRWSGDGKTVEVTKSDWQQETKWMPAYLDATTFQKLSDKQGRKAFVRGRALVKGGLELENSWFSGDEEEASRHQGDVLSVCGASGRCKPLRGSDQKRFGMVYVNGDPNSLVLHYDCWGFSPDFRRICVMSGGTLYTWSTRSGHLLHRVQLGNPKSQAVSSGVDISRDLSLVVVNIKPSYGKKGTNIVFEARTGKRLYGLPMGAAVGFSPSGQEVEGMSRADETEPSFSYHAFFDARSGRLLWECPGYETPHRFSVAENTLFTTTRSEMKLRDFRTGALKQVLVGPTSNIAQMSLSPDGSQLWTSHTDGQIWKWHIRESKSLFSRRKAVPR